MSRQEIPTFNSLAEEATFWDENDVMEFLDERNIIQGAYIPTAKETKTVMTIRIAPSLKQRVEQIASEYDISTSSLVRMWIVDKLRTLP